MSNPLEIVLDDPCSYPHWRVQARRLLHNDISPQSVCFRSHDDTADLFSAAPKPAPPISATDRVVTVPKTFPPLAEKVICHSDSRRHALLYRLLWRLQDERGLLDNHSDSDVWQARRMAKAVTRDAHKMKAFVRFRKIEDSTGEIYLAWFEPKHEIVEYTAPFFQRRFTGMRWSILTPRRCAHWNGSDLTFSDGARRDQCPDQDELEQHWRVYYSSIFNPARLKTQAMRAEMPVRYWKNLPEARLIPELTRSARKAQRAAPCGTAPSRKAASELVARQTDIAASRRYVKGLDSINRSIQSCTRCGLCEQATAAVCGEGNRNAQLMLVGEQPGDHEDLTGRPFTGPAGMVLDSALEAAGISRESVYLTNAVKHFKFRVNGKRRIHQRPNASEIDHCRWWLELEQDEIAPQVVVAMGATAARSVIGYTGKLAEICGELLTDKQGRTVLVTVHPSYLLRINDESRAAVERQQFIRDLIRARDASGNSGKNRTSTQKEMPFPTAVAQQQAI